MSEWISVNKPPKVSGRYIAWMPYATGSGGGLVAEMNFNSNKDQIDYGWGDDDGRFPSHAFGDITVVNWMPLPEPPKE